jgi:NADH-quinone oxidoreductase subunit K
MSLELMFNAVNLNLIAFSFRLSDLAGQVLAIFVITIAAAEAAIGLGLIIALVRLKDTVALDEADLMRS